MKKLLFVLAIGAFAACNDSSTEGTSTMDTSSSMMSTDTSAMAPVDTTGKMAPMDTTSSMMMDSTSKK